MPIRRSQKKRNAEPRQKQNHRRLVIDTMVNPGSSAHRHQARSKADPARPHHRMVTLAQSSPGDRSARAPQSKTATVMLGSQSGQSEACPPDFAPYVVDALVKIFNAAYCSSMMVLASAMRPSAIMASA